MERVCEPNHLIVMEEPVVLARRQCNSGNRKQ